MSGKANVEDMQWSRQAYTLREAIKRCTFPQIMKVVQGFESSDETETLARDQVLRINQIHTQTRVMATTDKKGRCLSIPLRYAMARFEVITGNKRSKPMYMREIIDKSLLPQKVHFYAGDELTFNLQCRNNANKPKEKFGTITLQKMYETTYLQGNGIQNNHLDTMVLNIPLHSPVEVVLAEGFLVGSRDRWERYQTLLDKIVSKNVSFELHPGNPHITFFTDKKLESADLQEHCEQITPAGTIFVSSKNDRLRQNRGPGNVLAGPSGARTLSAVSAARSKSPEFGIDRDNASVQVEDRQGRSLLRNIKQDQSIMKGRPRLESPPRKPKQETSMHATMPRSILKKKTISHNEDFPPPPADFLSPISHNPVAYIYDRPQSPPLSPPPQQGVRRPTLQSPAKTKSGIKGQIRADFPRPVNMHSNDTSPRVSSSSHNSSIDSAFSTNSSNDSRPYGSNQFLGTLPDPDYDHVPSTNGIGRDHIDFPSALGAPLSPAPPAVSPIPAKGGTGSVTGVPTPPPPPPVGFMPSPPIYSEVAKIKANQTPRQNLANKPPLKSENSRENMLQELKIKAERRISRMNDGILPQNQAPKFGNKSPRTFSKSNSPRQLNNNNPSPESELQKLLNRRKELSQGNGNVPAISSQCPPPAPAAKQSPGVSKSSAPPVARKMRSVGALPMASEIQFDTLSEVPTDLGVLSVSQVCQCLKLMNLDKYSSTFRSNSVDGQLMLQLNKETLKDSFEMSDWDAQRIDSFIKGWRPKY